MSVLITLVITLLHLLAYSWIRWAVPLFFSPIFITPGHSQGNGLAERTIGTLKELIHKVAYEQQKSWWKHLEYILWALREIPQSSTGVAPWTMAFGFLPKGPCSILKDTWSGDESLPFSLDKSVADYLLDCE